MAASDSDSAARGEMARPPFFFERVMIWLGVRPRDTAKLMLDWLCTRENESATACLDVALATLPHAARQPADTRDTATIHVARLRTELTSFRRIKCIFRPS